MLPTATEVDGPIAFTRFRDGAVAVGSEAARPDDPKGAGPTRARIWIHDPTGATTARNVPWPTVRCPPAHRATIATIAWMPRHERVRCFGSSTLRLRGWLGPPIDRLHWGCSAWLQCSWSIWLGPVRGMAWEGGGAIDLTPIPALQGLLTMGPTWLEVTGHFADPLARKCRERGWAPFETKRSAVRACRSRFVVTAIRVLPDR
jgi:hypothetical protein